MRLHHVNVVVPVGATDRVVAFHADDGAPWEDQPQIFGGRRGVTRDPEGNRVEILEPAGELA